MNLTGRSVRCGFVGVFALLLAGYGNAYAQDDPCEDDDPRADSEPCGGDPCGGGGGGGGGGGHMAMEGPSPIGVAKGKISIWADVGINLSADAIAKPFSIAPDVWYGVSDKLAVGLAHSGYGANGFIGSTGAGLCLANEENGCVSVYNNLALLGKYAVVAEPALSVVVNGGVVVPGIKDMLLAGLKAGADIGYATGKIMILASPILYIGVTERDYNKESLHVPVMVGYMVSNKLHAGVQTGIAGPLDGFGDAFRVPVTLGGMYAVSPKISAGAGFSFFNLAGKGGSADSRALNIFVNYNL